MTKPKKGGTVKPTPSGPLWTKRDRVQPLSVLNVDDALLTAATVEALTGDSIPTIDRKVKAGEFPPPITHSVRDRRWVAWQVRAHLRAQAEAQGVKRPAPAGIDPFEEVALARVMHALDTPAPEKRSNGHG